MSKSGGKTVKPGLSKMRLLPRVSANLLRRSAQIAGYIIGSKGDTIDLSFGKIRQRINDQIP